MLEQNDREVSSLSSKPESRSNMKKSNGGKLFVRAGSPEGQQSVEIDCFEFTKILTFPGAATL